MLILLELHANYYLQHFNIHKFISPTHQPSYRPIWDQVQQFMMVTVQNGDWKDGCRWWGKVAGRTQIMEAEANIWAHMHYSITNNTEEYESKSLKYSNNADTPDKLPYLQNKKVGKIENLGKRISFPSSTYWDYFESQHRANKHESVSWTTSS